MFRPVLVLLSVQQAACWCWSCSDHGKWSWWSCKCDADWEGGCCDTPKTCKVGAAKLGDTMCPQSKMMEKIGRCDEVNGEGPLTVGTAAMSLPPQMQGVFWLTEQGDSSALMSFATSNDGAGLSTLDLSQEYGIKVRVGGDRVWSFHDKATSWGLVAALDLIYKFKFETSSGLAKDISAAQIIPEARNLGISLTATNILDFALS